MQIKKRRSENYFYSLLKSPMGDSFLLELQNRFRFAYAISKILNREKDLKKNWIPSSLDYEGIQKDAIKLQIADFLAKGYSTYFIEYPLEMMEAFDLWKKKNRKKQK